MATRITLHEVAPGDDEAFEASWEPPAGYRTASLHRALRSDVAFRFVELAVLDEPGADRYEVVREDGTPDVEGGAVLIEPYEVAAAEDARFLDGWDRARAALAGQRGYIGARLHRSLGDAGLRFVDVARWSSPLMFARALERPEFRQAAEALPYASHPALYLVVRALTS